MFTYRKNNRFQKKSVGQNTNIWIYTPPPLPIIVLATALTVFILTHPVNFSCGRKPEHPEKTHDFRQNVDWLFSHESVARIEPTRLRGERRLERHRNPTEHCTSFCLGFETAVPNLQPFCGVKTTLLPSEGVL
jgi:hypothetical protein